MCTNAEMNVFHLPAACCTMTYLVMMLSGTCCVFGPAGKMNLWIQSLHVILSRIRGLLIFNRKRCENWSSVCDISRAEKTEVGVIS